MRSLKRKTSSGRQCVLAVLLLSGFAASVFFACSTIEPIAERDVAQARQRFPDVTREQLTRGQEAYARKCGSCHHLYAPANFAADQWSVKLDEMKTKAKVSDEEREQIFRYLSSRAKTTQPL